ncbi:Aste57867_9946 [Aphanomyces stellatus]|uniref:Aste57867_9946 protein n=1 Tax=Aphanomyces stellatus TaxID=120398 RepID=A0A485KP52_9STRA|nr:hypothetical protein As57867_009907 [Aphanomyces stellatus]VFT86824.1 Aste57867_9946 [Aphanomyces stellatus]
MVLSTMVLSATAVASEHRERADDADGSVGRVSKTSFMMIYLCLCLGSKFNVSSFSSSSDNLMPSMPDLLRADAAWPFLQGDQVLATDEATTAQDFQVPVPVVSDHPLHAAILSGSMKQLRAAMETYDDVDVVSKNKTPLMLASSLGHVEILDYLLGQGADVFAEDDDGNTGLHLACQAGHVHATYILLTAGADLDFPNNANQTPEDLAMPHLQELLDTNGVIDEAIVRAWDRQYKTHRFLVPSAITKARRTRYARFLRLAAITEEP